MSRWAPCVALAVVVPSLAACLDAPSAALPVGKIRAVAELKYVVELAGSGTTGVLAPGDVLELTFTKDLVLWDETGVERTWTAVEGFVRSGEREARHQFVVLDEASGCPRGVGYDYGLTNYNTGQEDRSRITEYLLGSPRMVGRQFWYDGYNGGLTFAPVLGALVAAGGDDPALSLAGLLPDASVRRSADGVRLDLGFAPGRDEPGFQFEFRYADEERDRFPTRIRWQQVRDGQPGQELVLVRASVRYTDDTMSLTCPPTRTWTTPRVPTGLMTAQTFPPSDPVPAGYPMRMGHEDALALDGVKDFLVRHPDGRMRSMWSYQDTTIAGPSEAPSILELWTWNLDFVSPSDRVQIDAYVSRPVTHPGNGNQAPIGSVEDERASYFELAETPAWALRPMVSLSQVMELARDAGFDNFNRAGWGEASWDGYEHSTWRLEYYHPNYGESPEYTRTHYWYQAETGWIFTTAQNIP